MDPGSAGDVQKAVGAGNSLLDLLADYRRLGGVVPATALIDQVVDVRGVVEHRRIVALSARLGGRTSPGSLGRLIAGRAAGRAGYWSGAAGREL